MTRPPTIDEIMRVRRYECSIHGHSWEIVETVGTGPVALMCRNCDHPGYAVEPIEKDTP